MSRTYRRTNKGQKRSWLPGIYRRNLCWSSYYGIILGPDQDKIDWLRKNPHRIKDVDDYFHWFTVPSHWNRDRHTKPRRAKERELLHKVKMEKIDYDDTTWPDGRKPTIYYW